MHNLEYAHALACNDTWTVYKTFIFSHGDILHLDFEDNYRNLTLKTMLSLRWALDECQKFTYVLKTDDDMIVNFDVLIRQLVKLPAKLTKGEI